MDYERERTGTGVARRGDGHGDLSERPTQELLKDLALHSENLVRDELRLARAEVKKLGGEVRQLVEETSARLRDDVAIARSDLRWQAKEAASKVAAPVAAGAVLGQAGVYVLLFALVFGLGAVLPLWAACLIVGALVLGVGAALGWSGLREAKTMRWNPFVRTTQRLKEDKRWMNDWVSERMRSARSDPNVSA